MSNQKNKDSSSSSKDGKKKKKKKSGYQFGDLTKSFFRKSVEPNINKITGKSEYRFGDLTKHLAKNMTSSFTGRDCNDEDYEYEFGDITKAWVANFTGQKDGYRVGDLSKAVIRRVRSGEYKVEDMWLMLRVLVALGAGLTPVAQVLPVKLLLQLLDVALTQEVGERLVGALASVLDERFKEALTGDPNYQIGDWTKRAVLKYIDKDEYEFGDIVKTLQRKMEAEKKQQQQQEVKKETPIRKQERIGMLLNEKALQEVEEWDKKFLEETVS